jgi:hypothetical protein
MGGGRIDLFCPRYGQGVGISECGNETSVSKKFRKFLVYLPLKKDFPLWCS